MALAHVTSALPVVALSIFGLSCSSPAAPAPASPTAPAAAVNPSANIDDPSACEECHEAVVAEWRESMHARAHHNRDPIYAGVRALRLRKEGEAIAAACALCHTPRAGGDVDGDAAEVGVGCAACHNVTAVHSGTDEKGSRALVYAGGTLLVGPHDVEAGVEEAHATGAAPAHMRNPVQLCLACHAELKSPAGILICSTGPEAAAGKGLSVGCPTCHMARVKGASGVASERPDHASHAFAGPHRAWYQDDTSVFENAVKVEARLVEGAVEVVLENRTGHSFPTGFPGRMVVLQAIARDQNGAEVARAWTNDAMAERPEAVLNKVYVDAEGKPTLAPYGVELRRDTRLSPGEKRTLRIPTPGSAHAVAVSLVARLLPAPLADKIGIGGTPEAAPKKVLEDEVVRAE